MNADLVACNNMNGLMESLCIEYKHTQWILFIYIKNKSEWCLAASVHNGNSEPLVPVVYALHMEETYDATKHMLQCIKFDEHQ